METLLEDYKRKLNNVKELIEKRRSNGSIVHQRREERLNTKAAEYRAFIVDIERAMARQQQQGSANCAIFDVSGSLLPEKEEITAAFVKCREDNIKHNLDYRDRDWFELGVHFCSNYNLAKSNDR